jgi:hypothetical protein
MARGPQHRKWVFTWNNPPMTGPELLAAAEDFCAYIIFQLEEAPTTGTRHFQGYVEFVRKTQFTAFMKRVGESLSLSREQYRAPHSEAARGSLDQNQAYCSKEEGKVEGPWSVGTPLPDCPGSRTDLVALADDIRAGLNERELYAKHPAAMLRYTTGVTRMRALFPPARPVPEVHLRYGPSGIGKTRWYVENWKFEQGELYVTPVTGGALWFDGMDQHRSVLIDEFNGQLPLTDLLRLLDRYITNVAIKGGFTWLCAGRVGITTNYHPATWYTWLPNERRGTTDRSESYWALARRFTHVWLDDEEEPLSPEERRAFFETHPLAPSYRVARRARAEFETNKDRTF